MILNDATNEHFSKSKKTCFSTAMCMLDFSLIMIARCTSRRIFYSMSYTHVPISIKLHLFREHLYLYLEMHLSPSCRSPIIGSMTL